MPRSCPVYCCCFMVKHNVALKLQKISLKQPEIVRVAPKSESIVRDENATITYLYTIKSNCYFQKVRE